MTDRGVECRVPWGFRSALELLRPAPERLRSAFEIEESLPGAFGRRIGEFPVTTGGGGVPLLDRDSDAVPDDRGGGAASDPDRPGDGIDGRPNVPPSGDLGP